MIKTILLTLFFFITQIIFSQETLSTSGGNASGLGGSSSFTVGQVFYTSNSSIAGFVSQGVQQAFEILF